MKASRGSSPNSALAVGDINTSCRVPLLVFFVSAGVWLVVASAFALIASLKFHSPTLLAGSPWLSYGRVYPACREALFYGFCLQSGMGIGLWILAQLGRTTLVQPLLVTAGAAFWNLGLMVGILGILAGDSTGFDTLQIPGYAVPFLFLAYLLIGLCAMFTFHQRRERTLTPPQWFLFTAFFWFAWIYSTAELLLVKFPVRGVTQAIIAWWFADNANVVWLGLVGLGIWFYFLPRLTDRNEDYSYQALFAYWLFILFASWGGIPNSAPVPAWMPVLSSVATMMTLVPLLTVALIVRPWCRRVAADGTHPSATVSLRFLRFSVIAFLGAGILRILGSLAVVSQVTNFTWFTVATGQLQTYGFFSMAAFGAIYSLVPQLTGTNFPSPRLLRTHYLLAATGVVLTVVPWVAGGLVEGFRLQNSGTAFIAIFKSTLPFLRVSTLGDLFIGLGHLLFLVNLCGLVNQFYRVRAETAYATLTADLFKSAGAKP